MPTKIELLTEVQRAIHEEEGQIKRLSKTVGLDEDRFAYYFEGLKFCDELIHEFNKPDKERAVIYKTVKLEDGVSSLVGLPEPLRHKTTPTVRPIPDSM